MAGNDGYKLLLYFVKEEIIPVLPIAVIVTALNILTCTICPPSSVMFVNTLVTALGTLVSFVMIAFLVMNLRLSYADHRGPFAFWAHCVFFYIDLGICIVGLAIYGAVVLLLPLETERTIEVVQTHQDILLAFSHNYQKMSAGQMVHHTTCFFFFNFLTFLAVRAIGHCGGMFMCIL
jgi:hypothetical protein